MYAVFAVNGAQIVKNTSIEAHGNLVFMKVYMEDLLREADDIIRCLWLLETRLET